MKRKVLHRRRKESKIRLKTPKDIAGIRKSGDIIVELFAYLRSLLSPGIRASELDQEAENFIRKKGGEPVFKDVPGYNWTLCVSVNQEIAHGIPYPHKIIKNGDIVSIDVGVKKDGYIADATVTFSVGNISKEARRLMSAGVTALYVGINEAYPGNEISMVGTKIEEYAKSEGYSVVREYVGHGVGFSLHEPPQIKHYKNKDSTKFQEGMVVAIEPMLVEGSNRIEIQKDGWTSVTLDGSLAVHFEHTIAITKKGPIVLTPWEDILKPK